MGIVTSYFFSREPPNNDPDPISGLTSRDKFLLKNSWETVMKDSTGSGVAVFLKLFEINPKYHQAFPFKEIPIDKLPKNGKFKAHCVTVIYSFGSLIGTIETPEVLEMTSRKIGTNHLKRGLTKQALKDLKEAMVAVFSFMTQDQLAAWDKFLDLIFGYMTLAIQENQS